MRHQHFRHVASVRKLPIRLVAIALACLVQPMIGGVAQDQAGPAIRIEVATTVETHSIAVVGQGFTAGGQVFITVHDQWGMAAPESRWVTASEISYQPPQGVEPGEGFSFNTGGNIHAVFEFPIIVPAVPSDAQNPALGPITGAPTSMLGADCTMSWLVRAYDRSTATWSGTHEVTTGCQIR